MESVLDSEKHAVEDIKARNRDPEGFINRVLKAGKCHCKEGSLNMDLYQEAQGLPRNFVWMRSKKVNVVQSILNS